MTPETKAILRLNKRLVEIRRQLVDHYVRLPDTSFHLHQQLMSLLHHRPSDAVQYHISLKRALRNYLSLPVFLSTSLETN